MQVHYMSMEARSKGLIRLAALALAIVGVLVMVAACTSASSTPAPSTPLSTESNEVEPEGDTLAEDSYTQDTPTSQEADGVENDTISESSQSPSEVEPAPDTPVPDSPTQDTPIVSESEGEESDTGAEQVEDPTPETQTSENKEQIFIPNRITAVRESSSFPSLNNPEFISADEATLDDNDLVMGLSSGGETKAYPLRMMTFHHVANDTIGGQPVAITY